MNIKLSALIPLLSDLAARYSAQVSDYAKTFSSNQGLFQGVVKRYTLTDSNMVADGKDETAQVQSTVQEKWDYFTKHQSKYIDAALARERTNSMGVAKANLYVDGKLWARDMTTNELMALKKIVSDTQFKNMLSATPIRTHELWNTTTNSEYRNRLIFELVKPVVYSTTTLKREEILPDPAVIPGQQTTRQPVKTIIDTKVTFGETAVTLYSGAISNAERAELMVRLSQIQDGITLALQQANDVLVLDSSVSGGKLFDFIFNGINNSIE